MVDSAQSSKEARTETSQHNVVARETARSQLEADVEAFLKAGGNIQEVPRNYRADPPKKPENNYGRGSI